jgi:phage shock protein C
MTEANSTTDKNLSTELTKAWVRSSKGTLAGVCLGMAERFRLDVLLIRLIWVFSFLIYGVGICFYIILAIGLPREDRLQQAWNSKILGVCARFAKRFDLDLGLVRVGFLFMLFASLGMAFFAYIILHFLLPKNLSGTTAQADT